MDTLSQASEVMAWLTDSVSGATPELLAFSYTVIGFLTFFKAANLLVASKLKKVSLQPEVYGMLIWEFCCACILVGLYFAYSFIIMEAMRASGLKLAGVGSDPVPIGEIARYADVVTAKVDAAVQNIYAQGIRETVENIPDIFMMRLANFIVHIFFIILGIIEFVLMAKFLLGFLVGGVGVGGVSWKPTSGIGMQSITYVFYSSLPFLALSFVQGGVMLLIDGAVVNDGRPASINILGNLAVNLLISCILVMMAPVIARELLGSMVTGHGAPDFEKLPRGMASHGGAATGAISAMGSMMQSLGGGGGGGGGSLPGSSSGGGGYSPSTPNQAPRLTSRRP